MPTPSHQPPITPELRQWLREQLDAGCSVEDVLASMQHSGWSVAASEAALRELRPDAELPVHVPAPSSRLPQPELADGVSVIDIDGHAVRVLMTMQHPRVIVFGGLLTEAECDGVIEEARPSMARSETVVNATGGSEVNPARTSEGMFFARGQTPLVQRVENRIARLLNWPVKWGEGLQVLHYAPGAEYRPHHDYFDPAHSGTAAVLARGGQRVGTLITYLNTPARGGATTFPDVALEVAAVKGNAVFFSYDRPHPATRTLHGGAPVVDGEKWVATKWLREREFH